MRLFIKQTVQQLLRFLPQQLSCLAVCLMMFGFSSSASAALNTVIPNTAQLTYQGLVTSIPASVDVYANITAANSATITITAPAVVSVGSANSAVDIKIVNTGINDLATGSVLVTPPVGTTLNIPIDPYGLYTATLQADGYSWLVTTPDILVGASYAFPATLAVPATATAANTTITADYKANGVNIVSASAPVQLQNSRTPAVISFLHWDSVNSQYIPADLYHAGQTIYVNVKDGDQNIDPYTKETVTITLNDGNSGDTETVVLTETGPDTGTFIGNIASTKDTIATPGNLILSVSAESVISATYTDLFDLTDTAASAALVDPFGLVFDSASGVPINGVAVTIINVATGLPATVYGDDAVSLYPSTVISGGTVTDASGAVYNFAPGQYRFPFMNTGDYKLVLTPVAGYSFPSQVPTANIQALASGPFAINLGSRGEPFKIVAGPALNIDLPLDGKGVNLFVRKTTATPAVALGDRVQYQVSIENVHATTASNGTILGDTLPLGFRYQAGSATLDGVALPDPVIAANGRGLSFNIGVLPPLTTVKLTYTVVIGANARLGVSENIAFASGTMGLIAVQSNVSKAAVTVSEDLIRSRGFIVGTVFIDDDMNDIQDKGEAGVAGIRIFMEDGRSVITDKDGRYHFEAVRPGSHILQMDRMTIKQRYQAVALKQTRFANNDYSQFAEVNGGGLVRANFRLIDRAPEETPVTVKHALAEGEADGLIWADVDIEHGDDVELESLNGFYSLPAGWKYVEGTASLDGELLEPELTPAGLLWKLDPSKQTQRIRLAMRGGGEGLLKKAVAYARFVSPGSEQGRTGLATINIQDTVEEIREQREFTLHLKFASRKATLPDEVDENLQQLLDSLKGLVVRELIVEGHTDNIPISRRHREEFADNMALSQARCDNVAAFLQQTLLLDEHIVQAIGKGELEPVTTNLTAKGREQNRRVVVKVRADKITHDFSSALQEEAARADGKALGSWIEKEVADVTAKAEKTVGILSPLEGMSLPHPIAAVRVVLDSRLKAVLEIDGEAVSNERIGFKAEDADTGLTTYTYIGVDFGAPGKHELRLKGMGPFGNARFEESLTLDRTGELAKIKLLETAENIADGKTPVRFRLALTDHAGVMISGGLELAQLGGNLSAAQNLANPVLAEEASKTVTVATDGWVTLAPVATSGSHQIMLGYNDVHETIELYVKPEARDWILVGFGEGTVGYNALSGATQPITSAEENDKFYQDGRLAFYAKGMVKGDFLMTLAYDTLDKPLDERNSRFGDIDPNVMYTVYGDASQQQFDAASSKKLYLKIERDSFYGLFGDYNTGLTTTELTRYSRSFTGVKAELHEDALGFTAFATQTNQALISDDIRGNGTSGLYHLSRKNILTNTDVIRIETVDRFKSEVILNSIKLTRHLDYDIDYVLGTIWFKQPVLSKDSRFNPIMIRAEYESNDLTDEFTTAGGRIYVKPHEKVEIGGTYVTEGYLGGSNALSGVDVKVQLNEHVEVRTEIADSINHKVAGQAWKVEARMMDAEITGMAYARKQDDNFGLGQQLGSENSTFKAGADTQYRLNQDVSLNGEVFHQEVVNTGAKRDMASVSYNHKVEDYNFRAGLRGNKDVDGADTVTSSTLASVGATSQVTNLLSIRADHEEALSQNNGIDFPTRSSMGADYRITATTSLTASQEWTKGQTQDTSSTRLGVNTQPWNGAQMSTSYEQQLSEAGKRSFANAGLLQTWEITPALSFSAGLDKTKVLTKSTPVQLNLNAPVATGGDDFTAYSLGAEYRPNAWLLSNRLEYRTSDLSEHRSASLGVQGSPVDALASQLTLRWQEDLMTTGAASLQSEISLRVAWRPSYDQLILLNRFDIRNNEQTGSGTDVKSKRYINNMTANWQTTAQWQLRVNQGIKYSDETIGTSSWSGLTDLLGLQLVYDFNQDWDLSMQAAVLRVRHLANTQPNAGFALGYNMFDNLWLSMGYNFVGFYDQDFAAAEYSREGIYMRFRFKYDQHSLKDMLK